MNTVGEFLQIFFDLVVDIELTVKRHTRTCHRAVCYCGHSGTTTGYSGMIIIEVLTRFIAVCHVLESGRTDSAVAQSDRSEFALGEQHIAHLILNYEFCIIKINR